MQDSKPLIKIGLQSVCSNDQFAEIEKSLNNYYGLEDEAELDRRNKPLSQMKKAKILKRQGDRAMLSSMEACDTIVVNAMMALELPYVREKFR